MGHSINLVGYKEPGEKYLKMKAVWEACDNAGVEVPDEIDSFFDGEKPSELGESICLEKCAEKHTEDMEDGWIVDLQSEYLKDIRFIDFYVSY